MKAPQCSFSICTHSVDEGTFSLSPDSASDAGAIAQVPNPACSRTHTFTTATARPVHVSALFSDMAPGMVCGGCMETGEGDPGYARAYRIGTRGLGVLEKSDFTSENS